MPSANYLFRLMAIALKRHRTSIAEQKDALEKEGLTLLDWAILRSLFENPAGSQAEVARAIGKAPSNVRAPIEILEIKMLVQREADLVDRRHNVTYLSLNGELLVKKLLPTMEASEKALMERLSADEQRELERLLKKCLPQDNNNPVKQ
ncbi:MAG: hypothetical protein KDC66_02075 [Phaeodactylibacter sp.]|nr:hypothetical protein [Phaeodactylibacter sp.]MCB9273451.1 hypothetical protein [Lewinellaceae bacterium]